MRPDGRLSTSTIDSDRTRAGGRSGPSYGSCLRPPAWRLTLRAGTIRAGGPWGSLKVFERRISSARVLMRSKISQKPDDCQIRRSAERLGRSGVIRRPSGAQYLVELPYPSICHVEGSPVWGRSQGGSVRGRAWSWPKRKRIRSEELGVRLGSGPMLAVGAGLPQLVPREMIQKGSGSLAGGGCLLPHLGLHRTSKSGLRLNPNWLPTGA